MKIDWKRKLTSRKFWAAVIGFITQLMLAFGATDGTVTQVVAVIMAGATLIAYMLAEGFSDGKNNGGVLIPIPGTTEEQEDEEKTEDYYDDEDNFDVE